MDGNTPYPSVLVAELPPPHTSSKHLSVFPYLVMPGSEEQPVTGQVWWGQAERRVSTQYIALYGHEAVHAFYPPPTPIKLEPGRIFEHCSTGTHTTSFTPGSSQISDRARCVMRMWLLWLSTMAPVCARLALPVMMRPAPSFHPLLAGLATRE